MDSDARISTVRAAKSQLRADIRGKMALLGAVERAAHDAVICSRLRELLHELSATFLIGYLALPDEARIEAFLAETCAAGTTVYMPRVHAGRLHFGEWRPGIALSRDEKGVLAPETATQEAFPAGTGLIIVPGRAFDSAGRRLGRGGGYYDRLLADVAGAVHTAGVAYETQIVDEVPTELHDRTVMDIVTERRLLRTASNRAASAQ